MATYQPWTVNRRGVPTPIGAPSYRSPSGGGATFDRLAVETRSAPVSVARFKNPQPSRTIGMVWRKTSPLASQLLQISEVICLSAGALREQQTQASSSRKVRT
jgi:hypothetical protein